MIVDTTALPDQVGRDIVVTKFPSAGQRCSALRLLFLQEDVADDVVRILLGAMNTLVIGDPAIPSTDVGPVTDADAYERLMACREQRRGAWIKTVPPGDHPLMVPPTLYRDQARRRGGSVGYGPQGGRPQLSPALLFGTGRVHRHDVGE